MPRRIERDGEWQGTEPRCLAGAARGLLYQSIAPRQLSRRKGLHAEHLADALVVRTQLVEGDLRRPALVEGIPRCVDHDVGEDE